MPLAPEDVVFRTNSDSKSLVIITENDLIYAREGQYGGFIIKNTGVPPELLENSPAWFVDPEKKERCTLSYLDVLEGRDLEKCGEVADLLKDVVERLPRKEFEEDPPAVTVEEITYHYTRVKARVKKVTDRYIVVDFEPVLPAQRVAAKAVRIAFWWCGSRRNPRSTYAEKLLRELQLKYPDNELVRKMYAESYTGYRGRGSTLYVKLVLEAPAELVAPAPSSGLEQNEQKDELPSKVVVRGFLVVSRLPSTDLLDAHLPEIFKDVKIGRKSIKLVCGYFYNKLKSLSRKFYKYILPECAVDAGFAYIVPYHKVPQFLQKVDELKKEYEIYEKELKEFLLYGRVSERIKRNKRAKVDPEYLKLVREYLEKQGVWPKVEEKIRKLSIADRVQINLIPFAIDMSILQEFIDEKVKRRVEQELMEVRKQIASMVAEQLRERARALVKKLEQYARTQITPAILNALKKEVEDIEKTAKDLGVELPELETLKEMMNEEKLKEIALKGVTSERVKALLEF